MLDAIMRHINDFAILLGSITAITVFGVSIYKVAKRIENSIGKDENGRTLSERMDKVEYQIWPNGGKSLADRMKRVEDTGLESQSKLHIIEDLLQTIVGKNNNPFFPPFFPKS